VVSGAATGDDNGLAAGVMADAVMVDLGACVTLDAATGDDGSVAAATTAGAIVAGASGRGCGARADGSITAGFGLMAARSVRATGLRPFACASNCRAASRVRQYPAA
jgi:hypothetical protein